MKTIWSDKHKIKSCEINKFSLSCFDNERYILDDGIHTLPYGHFRVETLKVEGIEEIEEIEGIGGIENPLTSENP